MAGALALLAQVELLLADADALLLHDGGAEGGEAVDAAGDDVLHILHAAGPDEHQQVHNQARIDAGTQHGHAVGLGDAVQLLGQLRLLGLGIGHLLSGGDDVDALLQDELDPGEGLLGEGVGAQQHHIRRAGLDDVLLGLDDDVGAVATGRLDVVIHAGADLLAAASHAHDVHALLLQQHVRHAAAHCAQTPDNDLYVFHSLPPSQKIGCVFHIFIIY